MSATLNAGTTSSGPTAHLIGQLIPRKPAAQLDRSPHPPWTQGPVLAWYACKIHPERPQHGTSPVGLCVTNAMCEHNHLPVAFRQYSRAPSPLELSYLLRLMVKNLYFFLLKSLHLSAAISLLQAVSILCTKSTSHQPGLDRSCR